MHNSKIMFENVQMTKRPYTALTVQAKRLINKANKAHTVFKVWCKIISITSE